MTVPQSKALPTSSQRHRRSEDTKADEHITLDDMFVIDSAGEYSVSGDEAPVNDSGRTAKRDAASSDARRRKDFKLFLTYLRSVDCKFRNAVSTVS